MKTIVSGIQPTGQLHLGNYLGSIKSWAKLQLENKCFFPIVDLHAITANNITSTEFKKNIRLTAATYIACGVDPKKSCIFQQSSIPAHSELFWILSCVTSLGKLNRMTQFKDKSGQDKQRASLGLYAYPVLMAADILLYKANLVPVGEDQIQHLELTNDIAQSFNQNFNTDFFSNIQPILANKAKRIMSLRDGNNKMSKSDPSAQSRICLTDSDDEIAKKIKKAKSDSHPDLFADFDSRPELKNFFNIISALTAKDIKLIKEEYASKDFRALKNDLIELLIAEIAPLRQEINELSLDETYMQNILDNSTNQALEQAESVLHEVKKIVGFSI